MINRKINCVVPDLKRPYSPIGGLLEIETGKEYQKAKSLKESAMEQKEGGVWTFSGTKQFIALNCKFTAVTYFER